MATITKGSKTNKINILSAEPLGIFSGNFAWSISGIFVFRIIKMKNICSKLGQSDLLSVYKSNFANIPSVNTEQILVKFSQNDLQMEYFQF